jgi:nucleotidyltransferase/DNA polymerase involved in DNA repair
VSVQSLDSSSGIRVGCLKVARMPLACELAERSELWHRPVVVAHPDTAKVWSASPAAVAEGIREGQPLSEATGRCPSLVVLDARPARYEEHNEAMLAALERVAPGVEPDGLGVAYVDLSGLIRSYRGPQALHAALLACAPSQLRPRLGVGPTKFVALLAASQARQGETTAVHVVGTTDVAAFMAPIAVEALPVSPEVIRRLRLVGITTIGRLTRLPRSALVAQFGPEGNRVADLLDGADEPVRPRSHPERLGQRLQLTEPLVSRPAVLAAADHVLERVLRHPRRRDRVARQVVVRTETEQGKRWESAVTLREPRGDRDGIWVALAPVLERAPFPGPVSQLSIELRVLGPPRGRQGQLLASAHTDRAQRRQQVEESLRQLRSRYGRCPVGRMTPVEPWSRIPERRWALIEED